MVLLLITVLLIGICIAGIAVKIWLKKGGEFAGTCASQSPFLNKSGEDCPLCGKKPNEQACKNDNQVINN